MLLLAGHLGAVAVARCFAHAREFLKPRYFEKAVCVTVVAHFAIVDLGLVPIFVRYFKL